MYVRNVPHLQTKYVRKRWKQQKFTKRLSSINTYIFCIHTYVPLKFENSNSKSSFVLGFDGTGKVMCLRNRIIQRNKK